MWFLETDDNLFGKRIWLRPGTEHLFGRTNRDNDRVRVITDKTISRTHLVIKVDPVLPGDSAHLHTRSKVTLTDSSKLGTLLNGERFSKSSQELDNKTEHVIKLGNFNKLLRIKWEPVTLSFTSLTKTAKQASDPVAAQRARLEGLDIKCIAEYLTQHTTHVVAKKRNTAAVLQALVNGRHVVTNSYVDALEAAGKPYIAKANQEYTTSALEEDFEANWPKELGYQPPPGGEPNPRPERSEEYLPNPERAEMFARYTFVFCDTSQYESLGLAVVSGGGGKALLREVTPDKAELKDFLNYVKEVAGRKGAGAFKLSQLPAKGGVIIVRPHEKVQAQVLGFFQKLDRTLDQQSMEQNEFLEAILSIDASKLKRPADEADENMEEDTAVSDGAPVSHQPSIPQTQPTKTEFKPSMPAPQDESQEDPASQPRPEPSQASMRRKPRRHITQSRFKGFDDFDPSQVPKYRSPSPSQAVEEEPSQVPSADNMDIDAASQAEAPMTQRSQRSGAQKRPAEPIPEDEETVGDVMDSLLKGAAAMKRRRLANGYATASASKSFSNEAGEEEDDHNQSVTSIKKPKKRKEKEIDIRAAVAERRQAEEEAQRQDEENLRAALEGMDVSEIRNLARIEEMDIVRREPPPRRHNNATSGSHDRWDDRWNGRKNFKKFRRSGTDRDGVGLSRQRVIVSLEEVKKKQFGIGDEYWLEPVSETRRKEKERRQNRSQSQTQTRTRSESATRRNARGSRSRFEEFMGDGDEEDEDNSQRFRRRIANSRLEDAENERTEDIDPVEIAGTARDEGIEAAAHGTHTQTQTQTLRTSGTQGRKRAAAAKPAAATAPAAKKRQTAARRAPAPIEVEDDDDDEDDPTKFRRRRR